MNPKNLQLRFHYQRHLKEAKGASEKTIDEVVAAIAEFEDHVEYCGFEDLRPEHSLSFKRLLMARPSKSDDKPLAKSTIVHKLGHLREFLAWVVTRPGYRSLNSDVAAFLAPPRRDEMSVRTPAPRQGMSMGDLLSLIRSMPSETMIQRRDRAAIAIIALTGVRDAALVSLRRKHLDLVQGRLNQDASEVDTKFGKNLWTYFFPVPPPVRDIVAAWAEELDALGYSSEGALLPRDVSRAGLSDPMHWKTAAPIREILRNACAAANVRYRSPHSIRHTLAVYGNEMCRTLRDKKAWSQNLGHNSMATTERSYGTLDHETVGDTLTGLTSRGAVDDIVRMLEDADTQDVELVRLLLQRSKKLQLGTL